MRLPRRAEIARFVAPAAFLLVVTIAVLLVRAGLEGGDGSSATTASTRTMTERAPTTRSTTTRPKPPAKRFYTIQSGDTLDTVAARFGTTTQKLLVLNPGIDTHALSVGQKIRVG